MPTIGSTTPTTKPNIFVGSSVEGLQIARSIQRNLEHNYNIEIWDQSDVFGLGTSTLEALEAAVSRYDFGIFVFTPDDEIHKRGGTNAVARDNVIFEAGLFIGKLGRFRSFIVKPRGTDIQVPTDLHGITIADYDHSTSNVGTACTRIRNAISRVLEG